MNENVKRKVLIGLMILSVAPLPFTVTLPLAWGFNAPTWLYVSSVSGYFGLVGLLWMYMLGTKSVTGLYFRDLAPIYKVHTWLGKYGTLLVFLHPIAVAISYGENILFYSWLPNFSTSFEKSVTWGRFAFWVLLIVWFTSALVRGRIKYRPWKYIHYLAYIALPLSLLHIPSIGTSYRALSFPRAYFMSVLFLAVLFTVLRLRHLFMLGRADYVISRHNKIAQNTMLLQLKPLGRAITPRNGQYVYLQSNLLGLGHPFSVLQFDELTGSLTLAYKVFGDFTRDLANLQPGTHLYVDGPYGEFTKQKWGSPQQPAVFLAGGIGVTPFVDYILQNQGENWLFHANKYRKNAIFSQQFTAKLGNRFVPLFSRESGPGTSNELLGRISSEVLSSRLALPAHYHYYICGNEAFTKNAEEILNSLKVPSDQVHSELFSF